MFCFVFLCFLRPEKWHREVIRVHLKLRHATSVLSLLPSVCCASWNETETLWLLLGRTEILWAISFLSDRFFFLSYIYFPIPPLMDISLGYIFSFQNSLLFFIPPKRSQPLYRFLLGTCHPEQKQAARTSSAWTKIPIQGIVHGELTGRVKDCVCV